MRFSVIIPAFNVAPYLDACLDSLLSQTVGDFEILLVDDGSKDNTWEVMQQYASIDHRISIYQKENEGVSAARNYGLVRAKGEFVCFIDGDDVVSSDYLQLLYEALQQGADSSMGGFQTFNDTQPKIHSIVPDSQKNETIEENLRGFYDFHNPIWQRNLWNRMYKMSVIRQQNLRFREDIHIKEDGLFVVQYLCVSNGIVGCADKVIYYYRCNPKGAMNSLRQGFNKKHLSDLLAHRALIKTLTDKKVSAEILNKAKEQAKTIGNWILTTLFNARCKSPMPYIYVEKNMCEMLGVRDYISWRFSQLTKKLK